MIGHQPVARTELEGGTASVLAEGLDLGLAALVDQKLEKEGCYLGLDRYPGRLVSPTMRTLTLKKLIDMGYGDRLCPSHDCICLHIHKERPDGTIPEEHDFTRGNPDQYLYMKRHVIPQLLALGTTAADIERLFVHNPRRFLAGA